jgi:hypothetical protein
MSDSLQPFPIVVGVPRSGTTLLRLMLDAHPEIAIPPETGFLLSPRIIGAAGNRDLCAQLLTEFPEGAPAWNDYGVEAAEFLDAVRALPADARLPDVLRLFYAMYARRHRKTRSGDKTPNYVSAMPAVSSILPEAHFVHIVRDGRDVALSWSKTWFAPSRSLPELVRRWSATIRAARAAAPAVRYLEVRYDDLVEKPELVLREICAFIGLGFTAEMLGYPARSADRLDEHKARWTSDGRLLVSRSERLHQQYRTTLPPQPERVGVWRTEMSPEDVSACKEAAAGLLDFG